MAATTTIVSIMQMNANDSDDSAAGSEESVADGSLVDHISDKDSLVDSSMDSGSSDDDSSSSVHDGDYAFYYSSADDNSDDDDMADDQDF